ncbi:hypothetical protein V1477_017994 [Vespula maculifrons]|uniref:Uncharacterized protein n=1 Tax=Vespula maculifrons TaxID=7453 RepID=A0ABD2B0E0_VESMC
MGAGNRRWTCCKSGTNEIKMIRLIDREKDVVFQWEQETTNAYRILKDSHSGKTMKEKEYLRRQVQRDQTGSHILVYRVQGNRTPPHPDVFSYPFLRDEIVAIVVVVVVVVVIVVLLLIPCNSDNIFFPDKLFVLIYATVDWYGTGGTASNAGGTRALHDGRRPSVKYTLSFI